MRLELLSGFRFGDLLDRASVERLLALSEGIHRFLGDRDVGFVKLGFIIEEPSGQAVFVECRETIEAIVDQLVGSGLPVDELRGECYGFRSEEPFIWKA
jgi:hypothetical protein